MIAKVLPKKHQALHHAKFKPSFFSKLDACHNEVPSESGISFTFTYFCKRYILPPAEFSTGVAIAG
jgi:hypothetical protein